MGWGGECVHVCLLTCGCTPASGWPAHSQPASQPAAPSPASLPPLLLSRRPTVVSNVDFEAERDSLQRMLADFQVGQLRAGAAEGGQQWSMRILCRLHLLAHASLLLLARLTWNSTPLTSRAQP